MDIAALLQRVLLHGHHQLQGTLGKRVLTLGLALVLPTTRIGSLLVKNGGWILAGTASVSISHSF